MRILLFCCLLCLPYSVFAQTTGEPRTFSLDDCLRIASEKSYEIKSALNTYQSQSAQVTQSFGTFLPSVGANMGYSRQLNVDGGKTITINGQVIPIAAAPPNSYSMSAYASYNIFNGFARESNYQKAMRELDAAELNLRRTRQTVSYSIRSQYLSVLKAMQVTKIRRENLELGKKELERMKAQYDAGRVPIASVYNQEADLGSKEIDLVSAENAESQAKAQLLSALALPPDMRAEFLESSFAPSVDDTTVSTFRKEVGSYNAAVSDALKGRTDFQATNQHLEAARSSLSAAKGSFFPNLNASGGWSWSNSEFDNFSDNGRYYVGMNLSIPIFDNFNTSTSVQQASIAVEQREYDRAIAEQKVRAEVQSAFLNLQASERQLEISNRVVRSSSQNFEAMKERLAVGAATVLEYQTANNLLVNAKINRVNAVYAYYDAQAQLRAAMGTLSDR